MLYNCYYENVCTQKSNNNFIYSGPKKLEILKWMKKKKFNNGNYSTLRVIWENVLKLQY